MPNENILHNDIRLFKSKPDGPVVEISNTAMTFPALDMRTVPGKAPLANNISIHLHEFLKQQGVDTHLAERAGKQEQAIFETEHLPFDLMLRNLAAGDLTTNFGLEKGHRFAEPLVEFFVRPDSLDKKPTRVSEPHLLAFELIDPDDLDLVNDVALRVNDLLTGVFFGIGVQLVDIRMEFGAHFSDDSEIPAIMLVSELSPDVMTLWDIKTGKPLDSSLAFSGEGDGLSGYKEITRRFDLDSAAATLKRQSGSKGK